MYKHDLALNNLQGLICHKKQTTKLHHKLLVGIMYEIKKNPIVTFTPESVLVV